MSKVYYLDNYRRVEATQKDQLSPADVCLRLATQLVATNPQFSAIASSKVDQLLICAEQSIARRGD